MRSMADGTLNGAEMRRAGHGKRPAMWPDAVAVIAACAWRRRMAWPAAEPPDGPEWIGETEFLRRSGLALYAVSHGICRSCEAITLA